MKRFLPAAKRSCLALASAALTLLAVETSYSLLVKEATIWHDPNTRFDPELGWSPIPSRSYVNSWGRISSNSLGFRSPEVDQGKQQILVLGDSVVWGYGVSDEQTMPSFLQRKLASSNIQVQNLGVSGYGIDQYYLSLRRNIGKFRSLKAVILCLFSANDLIETGTNASYGKRKPLFALMDGRVEPTQGSIRRYCMRNLLTLTAVGRNLPRKWAAAISGDRTLSSEQTKLLSGALIEKMAKLAKGRGAAFYVVVLPNRGDWRNRSSDYGWFCDTLRRGRYDFLDYLSLVSREDPSKLYRPEDTAHFSPAGNRLFAERLYQFLSRR